MTRYRPPGGGLGFARGWRILEFSQHAIGRCGRRKIDPREVAQRVLDLEHQTTELGSREILEWSDGLVVVLNTYDYMYVVVSVWRK